MPVRNAAWYPPLEQVTPFRQLRGIDHSPGLAWPCAHEQDQSSSFGDAGDDAAGAAEVRRGDVERDYVDALPDAKDVAGVHGVPEGGVMAEVGLGGEEEFESYGGGRWGLR